MKRRCTAMNALIVAVACLAPTLALADGTWGVVTRDGANRQGEPYLSSLAGGETAVGAVRSDEFELDADMITFQIRGHDGVPGQVQGKNVFALCDADTGIALRHAPPPSGDGLTPMRWDVVELIGTRVYFRAVDAVADTAFAWMGIADVRVGDRRLMDAISPGQLPDGWAEETRPEGVSDDEWLAWTPASAHWAVEADLSDPTWAVMTVAGAAQPSPPYLSSLRGGESGTGAVRSPAFTLDTPTYAFMRSGTDSPTGDAGLNHFQLVDAETLEILRTTTAPQSNALVATEWDTADLVGRKVFFRAADGNGSNSWAWIGFNAVPLGDGRMADFADPAAVEGWREEGQPEGTPIGGKHVAASLEEAITAGWRSEDVRRGVRWSLWESNAKAAPYMMARLARIMEADFERGEQLLREYRIPRQELAPHRQSLDSLRERFVALQASPKRVDEWAAARTEQRLALRELTLANPALDFKRLLFSKRFTQQSYADINVNHHAWGSRPGGDICILELPDASMAEPRVTDLLDGQLGLGNVHGIDLDWDAGRVLFSYARAESEVPPEGWLSRQATFELHRTVDLLHLYEMAVDGSGLKQLTDGQWSDLNPCYLPSGEIAFESERMGFEINCNELDKDEPTTNLFAMNADGTGIRQLAITKDGDWYPRVANDGSIVYSHWEYHERALSYAHPLWVVNPDGTLSDAYAKQHFDFPVTLTAPRPVPGSTKLIAVATGHHTLACGPIVFVDRGIGPNDPSCLTRVTGPDIWPEYGGSAPGPGIAGWRLPPGDGWYMDPYPLSDTTFLVSYCDGAMQDEAGYGLYVVDVYGGKELIYQDPEISSVMPIPLASRERPLRMASVRDSGAEDALCIVTDITEGVPEVEAGDIASIRIGEPIPWPYSNEGGGQRYEGDAKSTGVNWTPIRILGTVPVEADGSAYFRVPAERELYFQALDADGMELRRMRTYVSFQPGETRACVGCHETRAEAPSTPMGAIVALSREPSVPEPPPWGTRPLSFVRDVQPLITRQCVSCHTGLRPSGDVDLSPGLTASHNRAYDTLIDPQRGLLAVSSKGEQTSVTPVKALGSHASRLVQLLRTTHAEHVELTDDDRSRLYTWIDANAIYHDDFIVKRPEAPEYLLTEDAALWQEIESVHQRRCASCHEGEALARSEWVDLDDPSLSLFVTAPLAGKQTVGGKSCDSAVYADANDADCAKVIALLNAAAEKAWDRPRRDLRCLAEDRELRKRASFVATRG